SLKEAALAQYLASDEGRQAFELTLVTNVAQGWLALMADEELLNISRRTLSTREESIKLAKLRFDAGFSSELDYRQAESLTEAARATLAQQQRQRALNENALALLLGQAVPTPLLASLEGAKLADATPMADIPAGLPSDLLVRRPDIRAAEQQLIAANANIGAARAAFFPSISLTAQFGTVSNDLSNLFKSGTWGFNVGPSLNLPLFTGGRLTANLQSAQAGRDIAVAQYEKSIQTGFKEVSDALASRSTLAEQARAQSAQAQAERQRFYLSDLRYRNGVASYLDLLDAQRTLFALEQADVQVRLAQLLNQISLYKALGGGWNQASIGKQDATIR
ncbi:MAG: efflux transporter outer membrane subunit, partial [Comamonas sp.]|nr:efflux transporter outer membrane subunit [Candidatus Comamonas equi]